MTIARIIGTRISRQSAIPIRRALAFLDELARAIKISWTETPVVLIALIGTDIVASLAPAANAWLLRTLLAVASSDASITVLAQLVLGFAVVSLVTAVLEIAYRPRIEGILRRRTSLSLMSRLLKTVQEWRPIQFESEDDVTRLERARQDTVCVSTVIASASGVFGAMILFASFIGTLWQISSWLSLTASGLGLATMIVSGRLSAIEFSVEEGQGRRQRVTDYLGRLVSEPHLARETKAFQSSEFILERWYGLSSSMIREYLTASLKSSMVQFATLSAGLVVFGWFLFQLLNLVESDLLSGYSFVALIPFAIAAIRRIEGLREDMKSLVRGLYSWRRTRGLLISGPIGWKGPSDGNTFRLPSDNRVPQISLHGVSFRYPGSIDWILREVSLDINPGETLALVGVNGSGKTTLAHVLAGLYEPQAGFVSYGDRHLKDLTPARRTEMIRFVFQSPVRYPVSQSENISLGRAVGETMHNVADRLGLKIPARDTDSPRLGLGYSDSLELSGGQWQKPP